MSWGDVWGAALTVYLLFVVPYLVGAVIVSIGETTRKRDELKAAIAAAVEKEAAY